jgi:uncharacterized protein (DUF1810 family)
MHEDPFDLQRFLAAQESDFEIAIAELRGGHKQSHWMWFFIFPQLRGLGRSSMAQFYGIASPDEARAYLAHPVLGPRLDLATRAVLSTRGRLLEQIFGSSDDLKFHSSMTLFALGTSAESNAYREALDCWFGGRMDDASLNMSNPDRQHN